MSGSSVTTNTVTVGSIFMPNMSTLTINTSSMYSDKKVINVEIKDITIEISYRESPTFTYAIHGSNSTPPDRVWKEIYGLKDGKMTLLEIVKGKHITAKQIPEHFVFDDLKD